MVAETAPPFIIGFNEATATLEVMMAGFWSLAVLAAYTSESQRWIAPLKASRRWFALLVDNTRFEVQPADVSDALSETVKRASEGHRAPTALVVRGALSKLQARRIGAAEHVAIFTDFAEARRWIETKKMAAVRSGRR